MMKPLPKKTAIIHDVFVEFGGAERVLVELISMYPHADIYIPLLTPTKRTLLQTYTRGRIITSWLNYVPLIHSASLLLKPWLYWYWQTLELQSYQVVISSSHSFSSKAVITGPNTYHISYVHTSPRYLYTEFNETQVLRHPFFRALLTPLLSWLRQQDFLAAQRPDLLVANSHCVALRLQKYYRRHPVVVFPPVVVPTPSAILQATRHWLETWQTVVLPKVLPQAQAFFAGLKPKQYYLCVSRLAKQKGLDLAVRVCAESGRPLVVVGEGAQLRALQQLAAPNIVFLGAVSDAVRSSLLTQARGLLYCSLEEDFGMVTAEALAHGLPVIGYKSGGTAEIVTKATGVLFDEFSVASLLAALAVFEKRRFSATTLRKQAQRFAQGVFNKKIRQLVAKQHTA